MDKFNIQEHEQRYSVDSLILEIEIQASAAAAMCPKSTLGRKAMTPTSLGASRGHVRIFNGILKLTFVPSELEVTR